MTEQHGVVLLVDDEPSLTEALAFTLESRGYQCLIATDMTTGAAALRSHPVKVLVTDIMMPAGPSFGNVDASEAGFHFIEFVQKSWPRLPIVCLSVIGDQDKIRSLTDRGVRYLRKGETPLSTAVEVISAVASGRKIRL
jgi:DNA-binding NarL/FixJ family response regulator